MYVENTHLLQKMLWEGKIDFALLEGHFNKNQFEFKLISNEVFIGVCSPENKVASKANDLEELLEQNLILPLIIFFIVSIISIRLNIRNASEQERIRKNMINHAYSELTTISLNLNGLIRNTEDGITDYETNQQSLTMLSTYFAKLDTKLKWYATIFPPKGTGRNVYTDIFDFDYISYTLTAGTGVANDVRFCGITVDGVISEDEIIYLKTLRDDIDAIVAAMVSPENPPQENENLTTEQIDRILETFFDKWSYHNESSPYFLLQNE